MSSVSAFYPSPYSSSAVSELSFELRQYAAGGLTQLQQSQHAEVQMALLKAIPCMGMHQTALPFVQRALMPFSRPGAHFYSPELAEGVKPGHERFTLLSGLIASCGCSNSSHNRQTNRLITTDYSGYDVMELLSVV